MQQKSSQIRLPLHSYCLFQNTCYTFKRQCKSKTKTTLKWREQNTASVKINRKESLKPCSEGQDDSFTEPGYHRLQWYTIRLACGTNLFFVRHHLDENKIKDDFNGHLICLIQEKTVRIRVCVAKYRIRCKLVNSL